MKNTLTILALLIALTSANGNPKHSGSELNLKLYDQGIFTLELDNESVNYPSNSFTFKNLKPGKHYLKVFRHYGSSCGNNIMPRMIYNGYIHIPPKSRIYAIIDLYNQFEPYSIVEKQNGHWCDDEEDFQFTNNGCGNAYPDAPGCMSASGFARLKSSVMNVPFESDKLKIAKQGIAANGISSVQILELMELFSFESTKLKLAKFAYAYTFDKQNFFLVNNGFSFSSSINELNKFVGLY